MFFKLRNLRKENFFSITFTRHIGTLFGFRKCPPRFTWSSPQDFPVVSGYKMVISTTGQLKLKTQIKLLNDDFIIIHLHRSWVTLFSDSIHISKFVTSSLPIYSPDCMFLSLAMAPFLSRSAALVIRRLNIAIAAARSNWCSDSSLKIQHK